MAEDLIPDQYDRYILAILFASLFAAGSWGIPALYLTATPPADHVSIDSVTLNQTDNMTHNATVDYEARDKYPVEAEITLYQEQNGSASAVEHWTTSRIVPAGEHERTVVLDLTEPPPEGTYYYEFKILIHADYNVEKEYIYETDSFPIENKTESTALCCGGAVPLSPSH